MKSAIRTIEFICEMCGEGLVARYINTKDENEYLECPNCGYENTLRNMLDNEL